MNSFIPVNVFGLATRLFLALGLIISVAPLSRSQTTKPNADAFDLAKRKSQHWVWQPLPKVVPPAGGGAWLQSPIDGFVLAKLQAAGLRPSPPADRRTLVRRVTYDLIGLPPTPEEVEAALNDKSEGWFAAVVDRLLASPQYGERWGRHWLDLVRFAETSGHEFDPDIPNAHLYRDYVIRAFNNDVPYDQFVTEHVAGDLLLQPRRHPTENTNESITGTGFWFLGATRHSPVDPRSDEADRIDNQIDVFSKTFLGLTVACARCHDHPVDAISMRDYFALAGYIESSRYQQASIDAPERNRARLHELAELNAQVRKTAVSGTAQGLTERARQLNQFLQAGQLIGKDPKIDKTIHANWIRALAKSAGRTDNLFYPWLVLSPITNEDQFTAVRKGILNSLKAQAARTTEIEQRTVVFADFSKHTYRDWFVTGEAFGTIPTKTPVPVFSIDKAGATIKQVLPPGIAHSGLVAPQLTGVLRSKTFTIDKKKIMLHLAGKSAQVNLIIDGVQQLREPLFQNLALRIDHGDAFNWRIMDVSMWLGHKAYLEFIDDGPGYVAVDRILFSDDGVLPPLPGPNYLILQMLDDADLTTTESLAEKYQELVLEIIKRWRQGELGKEDLDRVELLNMILASEPIAVLAGAPPPAQRVAELLAKIPPVAATLNTPRHALAITDGTPANARIPVRGDSGNLGEEVPRRFLEAVAGPDQPLAPLKSSGRLELAKRMVDPANPLVARVMVNRIWQHHFGAGIVRSVDNFGALGELPTHPELLDWLTAEFIRRGWSIKDMHRLMLLSSTYQMASKTGDAQTEAKDPQNKLLHRMPIQRLEAEAIRDALLAVSGRLDQKMYGPGVPPFFPVNTTGRGRPNLPGPLDGDGRRSIYLTVRRNFLSPLLLAFDFPIPSTTMGQRTVSTVPTQALTLLNNHLVLQLADRWAKNMLANPTLTPPQRITQLYMTAYSRPPEPEELKDVLDFLQEQGKRYGNVNHPAVWTDLCHVLLNAKEFIFVN